MPLVPFVAAITTALTFLAPPAAQAKENPAKCEYTYVLNSEALPEPINTHYRGEVHAMMTHWGSALDRTFTESPIGADADIHIAVMPAISPWKEIGHVGYVYEDESTILIRGHETRIYSWDSRPGYVLPATAVTAHEIAHALGVPHLDDHMLMREKLTLPPLSTGTLNREITMIANKVEIHGLDAQWCTSSREPLIVKDAEWEAFAGVAPRAMTCTPARRNGAISCANQGPWSALTP